MSTTSLKLPAQLKKRIAPLAKRSGKTPHAWMVEALEREAARAEMREEFIEAAAESAREVDDGGALYAAEDVHAWLRATAEGEAVPRPSPIDRPRRRRRA